jgi:hypothetical protein
MEKEEKKKQAGFAGAKVTTSISNRYFFCSLRARRSTNTERYARREKGKKIQEKSINIGLR